VTTFHSFYNTHWPSQIMGKGERVIAVSQALAEYARSSFQVSDDHLRIVVNGISLGKIERTRPGRYLRVGTLARWSTGKGFSLFLKVMQVLVKEGHPVQGLIGVGLPAAGLKASSRLKAEIEEHGLSDRVSLLLNPRREDFFSRIDVYAGCFTRPEGFGRVVVEAQWCRVVPVASALGGVREVIRDGETGFLVEPRAAAFVERLKLLLSNDWLREKMGQAAATWVRQKFSAERMVEETVAVYRELV
ncbi:MAG TPA: glycosyltransferase family 4 protein, partial [bacterium]|nr:glycosyltransferase family 4 protein [bacterium]